jgi:cell division protein FtsL
MTIIQPNRENKKTSLFALVLMGVAVLSVVWGVFIYNQLVDIRHEVEKTSNGVEKAEVSNAELKNNLYNMIDSGNLESLAKTKSLALDKDPQYVKSDDGGQLTANH